MAGVGLLNLDLILAHGVADGFNVFNALGADHDLLAQLHALGHHGNLVRLDDLDAELSQRLAGDLVRRRASPLHHDALAYERDLLLDRGLDDVTANAGAACVHRSLADDEDLLRKRDHLLLIARGPPGFRWRYVCSSVSYLSVGRRARKPEHEIPERERGPRH